MQELILHAHPLGARSRLSTPQPKITAGRLRGRLLLHATRNEDWDMGKPGKASPSFKDMKNPVESYDQDSFDQADEPNVQPASAAEGEKETPSSAPESGTKLQESGQVDRTNVATSQGPDQQANPPAAPESGDVKDETSGRGHV